MDSKHISPADDDEEILDDAVEIPTTGSAPPAAMSAPRWLIDLRQTGAPGFYNSLGDHALMFADRGSPHLLVSFDNLSSARDASLDRDPWGYGFAAKNGWSQLGVMAFRPDWFRSESLFEALRDLERRGFFRRFASVTMTGTSMGGYAACAFAGLAPGCKVIAFSPQSTLKKSLVPWEGRFSSGRKADWSGDFADAAVEAGQAGKVWLVYDPFFEDDRRHADRFEGPTIHKLRARHGGHKTALILRRGEILSRIVREVVEDSMTEQRFYELYRNVRRLPWFLNGVAEQTVARGRPGLAGRLLLHMRQQGQGFAAHNLRKKIIAGGHEDPLSPRRMRAADRKLRHEIHQGA